MSERTKGIKIKNACGFPLVQFPNHLKKNISLIYIFYPPVLLFHFLLETIHPSQIQVEHGAMFTLHQCTMMTQDVQ
jgi:hypothetical protein